MADTKIQTAIDKARNKETGQEMEVSTAVPAGAEGAVRSFRHPDELAKVFADDMTSGEFEAAPQLFKLEEAQMIEGILEGHGPVAEFTRVDKNTGEVTTNEVATWIIVVGSGVRLSILSSAQLDRKLIGFNGSKVKIARGKDKRQPNGNMMTEYLVWGPRLKDGAKRKWFDQPVIEVGGSQRALPESTNHA